MRKGKLYNDLLNCIGCPLRTLRVFTLRALRLMAVEKYRNCRECKDTARKGRRETTVILQMSNLVYTHK